MFVVSTRTYINVQSRNVSKGSNFDVYQLSLYIEKHQSFDLRKESYPIEHILHGHLLYFLYSRPFLWRYNYLICDKKIYKKIPN